jgi:hypothetical protein
MSYFLQGFLAGLVFTITVEHVVEAVEFPLMCEIFVGECVTVEQLFVVKCFPGLCMPSMQFSL